MNRFKNSIFIDFSEESNKLELHQKVYGKWSKISNTFLFPLSNRMLLSVVEFTKHLSEHQTGKTLIRLLVQKHSDLGLLWLYRPFLADNGCSKFKNIYLIFNF